MIKTSRISANIKTSLTRQLFNLAKQYDDVVDFTLGDPDVQTHQSIKDAACRAIQEGRTRYSQNAGLLDLRKTIHDYYLRTEDLDYAPDGETIVTNVRHKNIILNSRENLNKARQTIIDQMPIDMISSHLKEILEELGKITGETVTEDVIAEIFSKFCLGK